MSAVCSLRYEALGKFREHSRVALGYASSNFYASFTLSKLPHASYLNDYMLTYSQLLPKKKKTFFSSSCPLETLFTVCSVFCWWKDDYLMFDTILNNFFFHPTNCFFCFVFSLLVTSLAKIGLQASLVACCVFTIWHLSVISISFHLTTSPLNHSCKSWE